MADQHRSDARFGSYDRCIKQYGERRTGTNLMRYMLRAHIPAALPLMHVLGDKHSPPVRLADIWAEASASTHPAWTFVHHATFAAPSATTVRDDARLLEELRLLQDFVTDQYLRGRLAYVVSVKNPYAWVVSLARYRNWIAGAEPLKADLLGEVREECRRFNARHRSWLRLVRSRPCDAVVVRYEDLLADPKRVVETIAARFGMETAPAFHGLPRGSLAPAHWDYSPSDASRHPFDPAYYAEDHYLDALSADYLKMLEDTLDWHLLRDIGYEPLPSSGKRPPRM